MVFPISRRSLGIAGMLMSLSAVRCTPDERRLSAKSLGASVAGSSSSSGVAGVDAESFAGESGEAESAGGQTSRAGQTGVGGGAGGDFAGAGGSASVGGGGSGTLNGGGPAAGYGTGGGGTLGGAGAGGAGGAPFDSACGDIDHNAVDDCTETLLLNSRFDADLANWVAGVNLSQAWDARDARAKSGSGSILVINQSPIAQVDASVVAGSEQCIPVTEGVKYELATRVMIPSGQGLGQAGLNLYVFAGDGCSGVFLSGLTPGLTTQTDAWVVLDAQVQMPAAARSVIVRLVASKPFTQEKLSALFDDVLVRPIH